MQAKSAPILTIEELAEYLKVSKSTLYKLAQEGKVPGQKVGRHWRFRRGAVDLWLDQRGIQAAAVATRRRK
jgi:excisionase family DNA binding protein